ncbi:S-4TM family putative pore-forming effector [Nonomuraea ferruginea]|uniref:S-4TM family putative pore-forming effector n=1 Tax=Nonomuraea ferruginea TaxID=46174 RepID=A0ABT4SYJ3_9ACTN|nr:S-4TM family putative pore-forming effector [Nonomuraea ferruginea]MDA0642135.1 S-4TM family putative pore-forming effector [Nonomuraea ferruginea]
MTRSSASPQNPPRGVPARAIDQRQLDQDMVRLQRAAAASHQRGQLAEALRAVMAAAMAAGGVVTTLTGIGRTPVAIVGFLWFLISVIPLRLVVASLANQGALLQEMFDTALFHLPWRGAVAGEPIADPDVSRLARKLKPGSTKDRRVTDGWYDPTDRVHHPYDVLIAQEQNLAWDARLRRRYGRLVLAAAIVWCVIGVLAGIVAGVTMTGVVVSYFVPSLAAYQLALETWYSQERLATERERLLKLVTAELRKARPGKIDEAEWRRLRELARDIQDGILRTRQDISRVPEWFYRHYRGNDERDFADTAEGHRRRLAEPASP